MTLLIVEDVNLLKRIFLVRKMTRFRGITLGNNPAGHCFVLRDLFPISFFKLVMIVLLKIYAAGKMLGKICQKAITGTFFSNMESVIERGTGGLNFFMGVISNGRGKFKRSVLQGDPLPQFPP